MYSDFLSKNKGLDNIAALCVEAFKVSFIAYVVFFLIDTLANNFISQYFNLKILLVASIGLGVVSSVFPPRSFESYRGKRKSVHVVFSVLLSLAAAGLVYTQIRDIGLVAYPLAILSGFIGMAISFLFLTDELTLPHDD